MSDVVIIGSGLGGLTCGYILQKNGYNVTVLEQGTQTGGCLQCFTRRGVKFETGMHFIGSAAPDEIMDRMFSYFGLSDSICLSRLDTSAYNTVSFAGDRFRFPNGKEAFIERMSEYFPSERDALRKYVGIVESIAEASDLRNLASSHRNMAIDSEYQTLSVNTVLDGLFHDEMLKNVLVGDLPLYSARLDRTPFSLHAFIMDFYNRSAFRIVGGSDVIAKSLSDSIQLMGGRVCTQKKVVRILCDGNRATGVGTADGTFLSADYIISAIHPCRTLEMLDTKLIRPAFRSRINGMGQTASVFSLYVKFKPDTMPYMNTNLFSYQGRTPWNCEDYTDSEWPKALLYMHMCHQENARWAESGVILAYMSMDDVRKWAGTEVGHRGSDYESFKKRHAETLIAAADRLQPGFSSSVECYYTSTPLTYLDYTGTPEGSLYGVAKDVTLGIGGRVPYRTRIPNLFLAGQNVNSHGILGVIVGTVVTCSEFLPEETMYRQIFCQK